VVLVVDDTLTLSKVDVLDVDVSWLETIRPMVAAVTDIGVLPTVIHVDPFADTDAVTEFAVARQLQPRRRRLRGTGEVGGFAAAGGSRHELDAAVRPHVEHYVRRASRHRFTQHHTGLGEAVGVLDRRDAGDDLAVAAQRLVHVAEGVGGAPDIRAGAGSR